jgi:hypothetical protein
MAAASADLVAPVVGAPLPFAPLTSASRHGDDERQEHDRYRDHDYDDSCAHGQHHDG